MELLLPLNRVPKFPNWLEQALITWGDLRCSLADVYMIALIRKNRVPTQEDLDKDYGTDIDAMLIACIVLAGPKYKDANKLL